MTRDWGPHEWRVPVADDRNARGVPASSVKSPSSTAAQATTGAPWMCRQIEQWQ
jgi:hypothetical protein